MEARPTKRSWPSVSATSRVKLSRHRRGATKGSKPSTTSTSAKAAHSESGTAFPWAFFEGSSDGLFRRLRRPGAALAPEVAEEFRGRVEHHHVGLVAECRSVRFQAAIERVELRIGAVRGGVDGRRSGVAFALRLLRRLV